jgi:hypothetical protein
VKTRARNHTIVEPSSRDSISAWLDVLTSMLALPEQQRAQIRDELEDHLRSRVDDLLITGLDESDAIRKAVSELGETAELAKVVTQAHTQPTQRRRIMQSVLAAAAIAGMSIGGFSLLTNTTTVPVPNSSAAIGAVEQDEQRESEQTEVFELENLMLADVLQIVAKRFGLTLDTSRTPSLVRDTTFHAVHLKGEYTLERVIAELERYHAMPSNYRLIVEADRLLTVTTLDYARYNAKTVVYPIDWASGETASEIFYAVEGILEGNDSVTQIQKVSSSLVVFAIPDVQAEAQSILKQLRETFEITELQRDQKAKIAQQNRLREIKDKLAQINARWEAVEFEQAELIQQLNEASSLKARMQEPNEESMQKISHLQQKIDSVRRESKELEAHYNYLRDLKIQQEYMHLDPEHSLPIGLEPLKVRLFAGWHDLRAGNFYVTYPDGEKEHYTFGTGSTINDLLETLRGKIEPDQKLTLIRGDEKLLSHRVADLADSQDTALKLKRLDQIVIDQGT